MTEAFFTGFQKQAMRPRAGLMSGNRAFSTRGGGGHFAPRPTTNVAVGARSTPVPLPTPMQRKGNKGQGATVAPKIKPPPPISPLAKVQTSKGVSTTAI